MGEIKSTLELAMERTKHFTISEQEKEEMKQKEVLQKATSLFHRYREGHLSLNEILKGVERMEGRTATTVKEYLLSHWIDALSLDDDDERILKGVETLKGRSIDEVKQRFHHLLSQYLGEKEKLKELQSESIYLQEEHADALERIKEFQEELREMKKALTKASQEREEALERIRHLESQMEQSEVIKIKGKLKEREASLFSEENRELQSKLEEALTQNLDLERKYETLKKSFHEVRESLTFLRDSCKANYYNLSESPE